MPSDSLTVAVLANTIFPGGGLMQFLRQSMVALANARPNWHFILIGSIAQGDFAEVNLPNVEVCYWDGSERNRRLFFGLKRLLKWMGKSGDTGFLLQSRSESYHLPWGSVDQVHQTLSKSDVVWLPHYNIDLGRLSMQHLLGQVNIPQLFTIHDIHAAFYPEDHSAGNLVRFYRNFQPFALNCTALITHSEYQKQKIVQQLGVPAEKIMVTPQPPLIDPAFLLRKFETGEKEALRKAMGLQDRFVFYPASTLHMHKNHTRLCVAWAKLKEQLGDKCPQLVFTNRGSRKQWQKMEALIGGLGIEDKVTFLGQVTNEQLALLFQESLFIALPTLYEGSGSGILTDAYVVGKRVVCSKIPQIEEQLRILPGANVRFFDGNSVLSMYEALLHEITTGLDSLAQPQPHIVTHFSKLWSEFAERYAVAMECAAQGCATQR